MSVRPFLLITLAALAYGAPAAAQDVRDGQPPLPPMRGMHEGRLPIPIRGPMHEPMRDARQSDPHAFQGRAGMGYDADQRDAWLDECKAHHRGPESPYCEEYLRGYEGAGQSLRFGRPPQEFAGGPLGTPYAYAPGYITPGYMVPPLMWVRVPIMRDRGGCDCQEVIEEQVVAKPAPRARRAIERRVIKRKANGKDLRSTK